MIDKYVAILFDSPLCLFPMDLDDERVDEPVSMADREFEHRADNLLFDWIIAGNEVVGAELFGVNPEHRPEYRSLWDASAAQDIDDHSPSRIWFGDCREGVLANLFPIYEHYYRSSDDLWLVLLPVYSLSAEQAEVLLARRRCCTKGWLYGPVPGSFRA